METGEAASLTLSKANTEEQTVPESQEQKQKQKHLCLNCVKTTTKKKNKSHEVKTHTQDTFTMETA